MLYICYLKDARKEGAHTPCKSKTTGESLQAYEIETMPAKKPHVQAKHLVGFAHIMISLCNWFVKQVFNTTPKYCCNLIYSCISYGCATLNGRALLTHRLIFGCPHYHILPSALFLPVFKHIPCIRNQETSKEGQHCSKLVPCSPAWSN